MPRNRLVTLRRLEDNTEIVVNFDHCRDLTRVYDASGTTQIGTRIVFTSPGDIRVKELLEDVIHLAEKA